MTAPAPTAETPWWRHRGALAVAGLVVVPVGAGTIAALSVTAEDLAGGYDSFVAFVATGIIALGIALAVGATVSAAITGRMLFTRDIVPRPAAWGIVAIGMPGIVAADVGAILSAFDDAPGFSPVLWVGLGALGTLIAIAAGLAFCWLAFQLIRIVFLPKVWGRFTKHRLAMVSLGLLVVLIGAAVSYTAFDPDEVATRTNLEKRYADAEEDHPFGYDRLGRDVAMRLWRGARVSLAVGLIASLVAAILGTIIGAVAGYSGGWVDALLMRFLDMMLSIPVIAVMIILSAINVPRLVADALSWETPQFLGLELSIWNIVFIVVLFGWMTVARLVRGEVLKQRAESYVEAARALGYSDTRILWGHIVPNCMAPIIVATTLSMGGIILYESALSYLGLGIQPPEVSWGGMVRDSFSVMRVYPRLAVLPGLCILITVVSFNFLGDGLRDALDPRHVTDRR